MKLVKPKPDISLANKTGHFNLLTTQFFQHSFSGPRQMIQRFICDLRLFAAGTGRGSDRGRGTNRAEWLILRPGSDRCRSRFCF